MIFWKAATFLVLRPGGLEAAIWLWLTDISILVLHFPRASGFKWLFTTVR